MNYIVTQSAKTLYKGNDFREAFSSWNKAKGKAKINVPISQLPKFNAGDDFTDAEGKMWRVDDYELAIRKGGYSVKYYVSDALGNRATYTQSDIQRFQGGGIVEDYQRIKEGIIFKNEFLARIVEERLKNTPDFWFERVGAMIYVNNSKYLDALAKQSQGILSKIEGTTDYISKMINDEPIKRYTFEVQYDNSKQEMDVMAFSKAEAKQVVIKKVSEKTKLTGKKLKKIQILAVQ